MSAQSTAKDDEHQPLEAVESPGKRLRIARQAKGMSQGDIATHLHLSQSIIQALENDDYDRLPGTVFVRGYLRNYARLLGLDDDSILNSHGEKQTDSRRPAPVHQGVKPEIRSSHFAVRMVSWILAIGLLGLLAVWWQGHLEWSNGILDRALEGDLFSSSSADNGNGGLTLPQPEPDQSPDKLPMFDKPISEPINAPDMAPATDQSLAEVPTETMAVVPSNEPTPATEEASEESPPELAAVTAPAVEEQPQSAEEEPATTVAEAPPQNPGAEGEAAANKIVFEFLGPCWVDIRDSTRKFKLFGEMSKGKSKVLEGTPPYSVILGNSSMVRVTVDGEPFDIKALSRGSVARFTLDPSTDN